MELKQESRFEENFQLNAFFSSAKGNFRRIAEAFERLLSLHVELGSSEAKELRVKISFLLAFGIVLTTLAIISAGLLVAALCLFLHQQFPSTGLWVILGSVGMFLLVVMGVFGYSMYHGFTHGFEIFPKTRRAMKGGWQWLMHEVKTTDVMH